MPKRLIIGLILLCFSLVANSSCSSSNDTYNIKYDRHELFALIAPAAMEIANEDELYYSEEIPVPPFFRITTYRPFIPLYDLTINRSKVRPGDIVTFTIKGEADKYLYAKAAYPISADLLRGNREELLLPHDESSWFLEYAQTDKDGAASFDWQFPSDILEIRHGEGEKARSVRIQVDCYPKTKLLYDWEHGSSSMRFASSYNFWVIIEKK